MSEFMELLPFLLPLTIAEVVLLGYTNIGVQGVQTR